MMPPVGLAPLSFLEVPPRWPPRLILAPSRYARGPAVPGGAAFPMRAGDPLVRACRRRSAATGVGVSATEQVGLERQTDVASLR
jgi:hypothetical protein